MSNAADIRKGKTPDPARVATCKHDGLYWYGAPHDERGWFCVDCDWSPGEEPGYSPQHDRSHLRVKVWCMLHEMVDAGLVSVSNSDHGEGIVDSVTRRCRDARRLDQESIVAALAKHCAGDGSFWRERHEKILAGNDPRRRCKCGRLAHIYSNRGDFCSWQCDPEFADQIAAKVTERPE